MLTYAASTPWRAALLRLPLSVVAPAEYLPCWGAVVQTVVVLAVAQPVLGVRRLLIVALAGHVLATLTMRALVHVAAGDVPHHWLHELDSGPSVAVLATAVACAIVSGSWAFGVLLVSGVSLEIALLGGQAGVEHMVGLGVGLLLALLWRRAPATVPTIPSPRSLPRQLGEDEIAAEQEQADPDQEHHLGADLANSSR